MKQDERCTRCGGEIFPNSGEQWPDGWIHSEPNNCYLTALARVEAAEAEARDARNDLDDAELHLRRAEAAATALAARVAELEAQLAAQGWRPGAEKLKHDWYLVYDFSEDDQPLFRYYGPAGWRLSGDRVIPNWYMPIPPLPPAPQETE